MREQSDDLARMFEWFDEVGYGVDIPELHERFPDVAWQSFEEWTRAQDWQFLDAED